MKKVVTRGLKIKEIKCGFCGLLYTIIGRKEDMPKSFECPVCKTAQQLFPEPIQRVHARRRNYPEDYYDER